MSEREQFATVGEEEIKRFRVGDILFSDEQAKMFCDLAMKGLRAEAAPTEEDIQRTVAEIFGSLDPASIVRRIMLASSATTSASELLEASRDVVKWLDSSEVKDTFQQMGSLTCSHPHLAIRVSSEFSNWSHGVLKRFREACK